MTTSVLEALFETLDRPETGMIGFAASADSVGATYIVDASEFLHSRAGDKDYTGYTIWRYNLTGDDAINPIIRVDISNGRAYVDRTYSDQTDTDYILLAAGIHPTDFLDCVFQAQRKVYREDSVLLSNDGADMDMARTDVNYWDGTSGNSAKSSGMTITKTSTPSLVYSRAQAGLFQTTSAGDFSRSQRFTRGIQAGQQVTAVVIVTPTVGTVTAQFYNGSASSLFGTPLSYSGESTAVFILRETVPVGCERLHIQVAGVGAGDTFAVDSMGGPFCGQMSRFALPATIDESFKLPFVRRARFADAISSSVYDAYTRHFIGDYINGEDFHVEASSHQANPNNIIFEDQIYPNLSEPLFLATRQSRWDSEPLTTINDVTYEARARFMAYVQYEVGKMLHGKRPEDPRWGPTERAGSLMSDYKDTIAEEEVARPMIPEMPAREIVVVSF